MSEHRFKNRIKNQLDFFLVTIRDINKEKNGKEIQPETKLLFLVRYVLYCMTKSMEAMQCCAVGLLVWPGVKLSESSCRDIGGKEHLSPFGDAFTCCGKPGMDTKAFVAWYVSIQSSDLCQPSHPSEYATQGATISSAKRV